MPGNAVADGGAESRLDSGNLHIDGIVERIDDVINAFMDVFQAVPAGYSQVDVQKLVMIVGKFFEPYAFWVP